MALLVSGGHTSLLLVRDLVPTWSCSARPSTTRRARRSTRSRGCSGLAYPGGPEIDRAAIGGDPTAIRFPRGLTLPKDLVAHRYDFSFSGLKTAVARWVEQREAAGEPVPIADVAAGFREAVVDVLVSKAVAPPCTPTSAWPAAPPGGGVVAKSSPLVASGAAAHGWHRAAARSAACRSAPGPRCDDRRTGAQLIMAGHGPSDPRVRRASRPCRSPRSRWRRRRHERRSWFGCAPRGRGSG